MSQPSSSAGLRAAIVGAGFVSDQHIVGLQRLGIPIVGIVDADFERAREKAGQHGVDRAYVSLRELLRDTHPDVVHVLTPPATHAGICEEVFAAGCHVYVETPMAITEADCQRMIEAARRAERELCVGHSLLYDPLMQRARHLIAGGELGELQHVTATYAFDLAQIPGLAGKWYRQLAGGVVENLASHPASLLVHLLGSVRTVHHVPTSTASGELRQVSALVECERGVGTLLVSLDARPQEVSLELRGTLATATLNFTTMTMAVRRERGIPLPLASRLTNLQLAAQVAGQTVSATARVARGKADTTNGIHSLIGAFYASLRTGGGAPVTGEDGRRVVRLLREIWPERSVVKPPPSRYVISPSGDLVAADRLGSIRHGDGGETALVTGATGFIGRHLVKALVERGVRVRALARSAERGREIAGPNVEVVVGDFGDPAVIPHLCEGVDVVYHLASVMRGRWEDFQLVDIAGARRLLKEAKRAGVRRLVFTSTLGAYPVGDLPDGAVVTEEKVPGDSPEHVSPYARAKLTIERMFLSAAASGEIEVVVTRPGLVFGPGSTPYLTHLPHLGLLRGDRYVLFGDGNVPLPLTYVGNMVDALIRCARVPDANGKIFTIVDDDIPTQREYVRRLAELTGRPLRVTTVPRAGAYLIGLGVESAAKLVRMPPPTTRRLLMGKTHKVRFDCSRAKEVLGWTPVTSWEEGLQRNVEWASQRNGRHSATVS